MGRGPADGPPIAYDSAEVVRRPQVGHRPGGLRVLALNVPPGGTLDLSTHSVPSAVSPSIWSTDSESSVMVAVRFRDDQGRTIEAVGSIAVP